MKKVLQLISVVLLLTTFATSSFAAFRDVASTDPDIAAYNFVQTQGIMTGSEDGNFHPELGLTRCELAKVTMIAGRFLPLTGNGQPQEFSDIPVDHWCHQHVRVLRRQNVLNGYPDGTFRPNQKVTQIEALKILINASRSGVALPTITTQRYTDARISDWWAPYIQFAQDSLYTNSPQYLRRSASYGIQSEMSRAETAYLIWKLFATPTTTTPASAVSIGLGEEGSYFLVNLGNGERSNLLPPEYKLLGRTEYQEFPSHLILQKGQEIFSYTVSTKAITKVTSIPVGTGETIEVKPSLSEKHKFFISVQFFDPDEDVGMSTPKPIRSTSYILNATNNTATPSPYPEARRGSCSQFDSAKNQFYLWTCQEGIGSVGPLQTINLQGQVTETLVARGSDTEREFFPLRYNDGAFFSLEMRTGQTSTIRIITVRQDRITNDAYTMTDSFIAQHPLLLNDLSYPYGITRDTKTSTIIVGNSSRIILLHYNAQKEITDIKEITDQGIYPNFLFANEGELSYQSPAGTRIVDLHSWETQKTVPGLLWGEITLF